MVSTLWGKVTIIASRGSRAQSIHNIKRLSHETYAAVLVQTLVTAARGHSDNTETCLQEWGTTGKIMW
jgi:hypothetical protein